MRYIIFIIFMSLTFIHNSPAVDVEGLIMYYPFEGTFMDESGNNQHPISVDANLSRGIFGDAAMFDGKEQEIRIPSVLNGETNEFTIEMWVYWMPKEGLLGPQPGVIFSQLAMVDVFDSSNPSLQTGTEISKLEIQFSSTIRTNQEYKVNFSDISSLISYVPISFPFVSIAEQPVWYHLALVSDTTRMKTYVNGKFITTGGRLPHPFGDIEWILGGAHPLGPPLNIDSPHFSGVIDEFRVWDHARTEDQILSNMKISLLEREQSLPQPTPTPLPERLAFESVSPDFSVQLLHQLDSEMKTRPENWLRGINNDLLMFEKSQTGSQIVWYQSGQKTIVATSSKREQILGLYPVNEDTIWVIVKDTDNQTWNVFQLTGLFHPVQIENFMQF